MFVVTNIYYTFFRVVTIMLFTLCSFTSFVIRVLFSNIVWLIAHLANAYWALHRVLEGELCIRLAETKRSHDIRLVVQAARPKLHHRPSSEQAPQWRRVRGTCKLWAKCAISFATPNCTGETCLLAGSGYITHNFGGGLKPTNTFPPPTLPCYTLDLHMNILISYEQLVLSSFFWLFFIIVIDFRTGDTSCICVLQVSLHLTSFFLLSRAANCFYSFFLLFIRFHLLTIFCKAK